MKNRLVLLRACSIFKNDRRKIPMGKISPVSAKYIVNATINIEGVVDRPDVIGAIFGQTEGLLGSDLELRELQRSGRIGRIEVNVDTRSGKTVGNIVIPSSLDKAETSIVGASLEIIQRIGPCNAKILVVNIEDVRVAKRSYVIERAKQLLKNMMDNVLPDSQKIAEEVAHSVRITEIGEYGKERLPCGPAIDESDELLVVEGRADVLNLLKHGFKNVIAMNGTSVPETIIDLSRKKILTVFVDGDRGGNLILKELFTVGDSDFVTWAPDGKEVEELTKKEIHKSIRAKVSAEQGKLDVEKILAIEGTRHNSYSAANARRMQPIAQKPVIQRPVVQVRKPVTNMERQKNLLKPEERIKFKDMLETLIGTRGGYILDNELNILGKFPVSELMSTLKSLNTAVYAVVFDGAVDKILAGVSEKIPVTHIVAMHSTVQPYETEVNVVTLNDL